MEHHTAEKTFPDKSKLSSKIGFKQGRTPTEDEESAQVATFFPSPLPHISGLVLCHQKQRAW